VQCAIYSRSDIKKLLLKVKPQLSKKTKPVVIPPRDFTIPTPKPLTVADGDYYGVISGAIALGLRLGTGVFAVGWSPFGSKSSGAFAQ